MSPVIMVHGCKRLKSLTVIPHKFSKQRNWYSPFFCQPTECETIGMKFPTKDFAEVHTAIGRGFGVLFFNPTACRLDKWFFVIH